MAAAKEGVDAFFAAPSHPPLLAHMVDHRVKGDLKRLKNLLEI